MINGLNIGRYKTLVIHTTDNKTSQHQEYGIETLLKWLGSLKITEEALEWTIEYMNKMSTVLANIQNKMAGLPKNIVLDPGWFNKDRIKFKD